MKMKLGPFSLCSLSPEQTRTRCSFWSQVAQNFAESCPLLSSCDKFRCNASLVSSCNKFSCNASLVELMRQISLHCDVCELMQQIRLQSVACWAYATNFADMFHTHFYSPTTVANRSSSALQDNLSHVATLSVVVPIGLPSQRPSTSRGIHPVLMGFKFSVF
jgi:hypothetical protein